MNNKYERSNIDFTYFFHSFQHFDLFTTAQWMQRYWTLGFVIVIMYLITIYVGQRVMKNRASYELRKLLFVWNTSLAIFSAIGASKFIQSVYNIWIEHGFKATVCLSPYLSSTDEEKLQNTGYWMWLFCLSKVVELGDTVFIVLRKQRLVFLHWYHHVTVLIYTWYSIKQMVAPGRWFMLLNYSVHTVMYGYYALRAAKVRVPKVVAMVITFGQITQMIVGLYVNWSAFKALTRAEECVVNYENIAGSLLMYASYWVLFAHLFYINYVKKDLMRGKYD